VKYAKSIEAYAKENKLTFNPRCELVKEGDEKHIYLEGGIYKDDPWSDDNISAKKVKEMLDGDVVIHLNSPGGSTFEGIAIYNILKDHPGKVTVQIDGIAASAASIMAMGADVVRARPSSMMMIHKGWTIAIGNAEELRETANMLDKVDEASDKAYLDRFNGKPEELEEMLTAETFLTAEDAFAIGLIDEIMTDEAKPVEEPEEEVTEEPKTLFDSFKASAQGANFFANFRRNE
jgi:ATP-dependent Clp protease, protease subunit